MPASLCLLIATFLWGSSFIALKYAIDLYHPAVVIFLRMLTTFSLCMLLWRYVKKFDYQKGDWKYLLGMSLADSNRQVLVVTGDGELMMNLGSLASVATVQPKNLAIICIDNGCHGETGGQKGHTSFSTDLELIAKGAGFNYTMTISETPEIKEASEFLKNKGYPRFLVCRVMDGPPAFFKRNIDPAACRLRFKAHVEATKE